MWCSWCKRGLHNTNHLLGARTTHANAKSASKHEAKQNTIDQSYDNSSTRTLYHGNLFLSESAPASSTHLWHPPFQNSNVCQTRLALLSGIWLATRSRATATCAGCPSTCTATRSRRAERAVRGRAACSARRSARSETPSSSVSFTASSLAFGGDTLCSTVSSPRAVSSGSAGFPVSKTNEVRRTPFEWKQIWNHQIRTTKVHTRKS